MKKPVLLIAVGVVLAAGLAWYLARPGSGAAVDLLDEFPRALEKRPAPETFSIGDVTIAGVTKRARVLRLGLPDRYVTHGKPALLHEEVGLTGEAVAERVLNALKAGTRSLR